MKQKKYFNLVDKNGYTIFQAEVEHEDYYMNVELYRFSSWEWETKKPIDKDFVTSVYYKFDYCSHWSFFGQDYLDGDNDSYYHLCGIQSINNFQRAMSFINRIFERIVIKRMADERDEISDKIDNVLLEGYTIEEVDSKGLTVKE